MSQYALLTFQYSISGSGVVVEVENGAPVEVHDHVYRLGTVKTPSEGIVSARKIGFPIMIKASEGGGGKGIRKVESEEAFENAFRQVQRTFLIFM